MQFRLSTLCGLLALVLAREDPAVADRVNAKTPEVAVGAQYDTTPMQIYWHGTPPSYTALQSIQENRVYVAPERADAFVRSFLGFSHERLVSDDRHADGIEIGRIGDFFRRIRIESTFGKLTAFVTGGHIAEIHAAISH